MSERPGLPARAPNIARDTLRIALPTSWDGQDESALKSRLEAYADAGINHVMVEPTDRERDPWLHSVEKLATAGGLA